LVRRTGKSRVTTPKADRSDYEIAIPYTVAEAPSLPGEQWIFDEAIDLIPGGIKFNTQTGDVIVNEKFDFPMSELAWQAFVDDAVAHPGSLQEDLHFGRIRLDESGNYQVTEQGKESMFRLFQYAPTVYLSFAHPEKYELILSTENQLDRNSIANGG